MQLLHVNSCVVLSASGIGVIRVLYATQWSIARSAVVRKYMYVMLINRVVRVGSRPIALKVNQKSINPSVHTNTLTVKRSEEKVERAPSRRKCVKCSQMGPEMHRQESRTNYICGVCIICI